MATASTVRPEPLRSRLHLLLIIGVVASCRDPLSVSLPNVNYETVIVNAKRGTVYVDDSIFSGTLYRLYPNSSDTAWVQNYRDGKEHGEWKQFYPNERLREIRYFQSGKKEGEYQAWWSDGQPRLTYHFADGDYHGTCREWNQHGVLVKEMTYKHGHEAGPQKLWYGNGKIKANYVVKHGRRYGLLGTKNCTNVTDSIFSK